MAWKLWLRGLIAAVINGASSTLAVMVIDPLDFNLETGLLKLGKVAFVSGLMGAFIYLKQHPDPWDERL